MSLAVGDCGDAGVYIVVGGDDLWRGALAALGSRGLSFAVSDLGDAGVYIVGIGGDDHWRGALAALGSRGLSFAVSDLGEAGSWSGSSFSLHESIIAGCAGGGGGTCAGALGITVGGARSTDSVSAWELSCSAGSAGTSWRGGVVGWTRCAVCCFGSSGSNELGVGGAVGAGRAVGQGLVLVAGALDAVLLCR